MNRDNNRNSIDLILVGKCHLSLSDCRKEEIIRLVNFINGFAARGYSIRGIHHSLIKVFYCIYQLSKLFSEVYQINKIALIATSI